MYFPVKSDNAYPTQIRTIGYNRFIIINVCFQNNEKRKTDIPNFIKASLTGAVHLKRDSSLMMGIFGFYKFK